VARLQGAEYLFLLTTTAREFFLKENYTLVDRNSVPLSIKETSEFTGLCPSSATVMRKQLEPV
jgi:amino-acid N-acetyltransferase